MMTAATIYMSLLGPSGLRRVAEVCHSKMNQFVEKVTAIEGVTLLFNSPYFHEVVLQFPRSAKEIVSQLMEERIEAGFVLSEMGDKMDRALLECCTETTMDDDMNRYVEQLRHVLSCR